MVHAEVGTSMGTGERAGSPELTGGGDRGAGKTTEATPVGFGPAAAGDDGEGDAAQEASQGMQTTASASERRVVTSNALSKQSRERNAPSALQWSDAR